jgi:hypothetical protein
VNRFSHLASELSEGEPLTYKLRDCNVKAASVIKVFTVVETEHLLI